MNLIVCTDMNWGIGKDNKLLTHLPSDLRHFKELTENKIVVMGRKTLESLPNGKPLPNRTNVIISSDYYIDEKFDEYQNKGMILFDLDNFVRAYKEMKGQLDDVFVIGGGSIYSQLLPYCDKAYVTMMYEEFEADTFFPNLNRDEEWQLTDMSDGQSENGISFRYLVYERWSDND